MNRNIVEILVDILKDYKNSGDHVREKLEELDLHPDDKEYLELTFEGIIGLLKRTV